MKKLLSWILALAMTICMVPAAFAASDEATEAAEALYEQGLFKGTGTNPDGTPIFDLAKTPTRNQAIIMLVRLLGKEEEAKAGTWEIPFTDVSDSMRPYIGYAYTNGLTNGYTATTYCGAKPVNANQYLAFVLRSLGYVSGVDFEVATAWKLSDQLGITHGQYVFPDTFTRGDVAVISYNSLSCSKKGADIFQNIPEETAEQARRFRQFQSRFHFPITSKGLTLTWEQARALVGQDLITVKTHVKSLEDVLYYLVAAGHTRGNGDQYLQLGGYEWHYNASPAVVLNLKEGNCGGNAGLVACLLEDDYNEVGMINLWSAGTVGGHVANYLQDGEMYLAFDVNKFVGGASSGYDRPLDLHKNRDLDKAVLDSFGREDGDHTYVLIATLAGCYDGDAPTTGPNPEACYYAEGYMENFHVVREKPEEGYVYQPVPVSDSFWDLIWARRNLAE